MNAQAVLHGARDVYATAKRYRDHGHLRHFDDEPAHSTALTATFSTTFERDGDFDFQFQTDRVVLSVRGTSKGGLAHFAGLPVSATTLADAIASCTGVTFMAAHLVPRLLLPGIIGGRNIGDAQDATISRHESVGEEPCFVIELGEDWLMAEVFIAKERLALRRVHIRHRAPNEEFQRRLADLGAPFDRRAAARSTLLDYDPDFS